MYSSRKDDQITFYLKPRMAKGIIKWSRFFAIVLLFSGASLCMTVVGIPAGIMGIIAAVKLIQSGIDMDAYITSGNMGYSVAAGNNFYMHFKKLMTYYILSIIMTVIIIIAFVVLAIVFSEEIAAFFDEIFAEYGEELFPEVSPGSSGLPL